MILYLFKNLWNTSGYIIDCKSHVSKTLTTVSSSLLPWPALPVPLLLQQEGDYRVL